MEPQKEESKLKAEGDANPKGGVTKENSYTYWKQNNMEQFPQYKDTSVIAPKKIDDPEILKQLVRS